MPQPTTNAENAEVEWFYEDLQDILELTPPKDLLFITGNCNTKNRKSRHTQKTGKFVLEYKIKRGKS